MSYSFLYGNAYKLDREKYLNILQSEGLNAAITALHEEMWEIEFDCFEGPGGYKSDIYDTLVEYRNFSRELWQKSYQVESA